jgi:hypothetical protein
MSPADAHTITDRRTDIKKKQNKKQQQREQINDYFFLSKLSHFTAKCC